MTLVKIDKNVSMPMDFGNRKYPWYEMEVGDSFVYPGEKYKASATATNQTRGGKIFKARKMQDGAVRIFRTV